MRRTQPTTKKAKISSTTHVQMLQWLHGKQQQHETKGFIGEQHNIFLTFNLNPNTTGVLGSTFLRMLSSTV